MGSPAILCANRGISVTNQHLLTDNVSSYSPYMEASSARDIETKVAPKPTRMYPYSIEAGPPFNRANWKVIAKASQETSMMSPKLIDNGRKINVSLRVPVSGHSPTRVKSFRQDLLRAFVSWRQRRELR